MRSLAPALPLLVAFALGCNTPPKDPPRDGAEVPPSTSTTIPTSASAIPTFSATPPGSAKPLASETPSACSSDADCRTFSSYCTEAPCACRVLTKSDGDPKCLGGGPKVSCFANPCMNKVARCQSGVCALTAKGSAAAAEK